MSTRHPQYKMVVFDMNPCNGNFESRMCAFITGQIGDSQVGKDIADSVTPNLRHLQWYERFVAFELDNHGNLQPATMWCRGSQGLSGVAIFLREFPPESVLAEMVERAKQFAASNRMQLQGCRLLEPQYDVKQVRQVQIS